MALLQEWGPLSNDSVQYRNIPQMLEYEKTTKTKPLFLKKSKIKVFCQLKGIHF